PDELEALVKLRRDLLLVPNRRYSLRGGCETIDEGTPVRFLSSAPGVEAHPGTSSRDADVSGAPIINKGGLAEDWLIWSLVSCVGLYVVPPTKMTGPGASDELAWAGRTRDATEVWGMKLPGLFLNAKTFQEVPAGTLIFEAGASGTAMFGIVEGEVEV